VLSFAPTEAEPSVQMRLHFAADPTENDWVGIATGELVLPKESGR
jgi:hypothetical protein